MDAPPETGDAPEGATELPDGTEAAAREAFQQGREAFHEGRFEYALERFRFAHDRSGHPELLYNVGVTLERLQHPEEALDTLRHYLDLVPDSPVRASVEGRIGALERAVAERRALEAQAAATHASPVTSTSASPAEAPADDDGSVAEQWWFWTIVAALAVGAGVGITLGVVLSEGGVEQPLPGDEGVVVTTLAEW